MASPSPGGDPREAHPGREQGGEHGHAARGLAARRVVDPKAAAALEAAQGLLRLPAPLPSGKPRRPWVPPTSAAMPRALRKASGSSPAKPRSSQAASHSVGWAAESAPQGAQHPVLVHVGRDDPDAERVALGVDHHSTASFAPLALLPASYRKERPCRSTPSSSTTTPPPTTTPRNSPNTTSTRQTSSAPAPSRPPTPSPQRRPPSIRGSGITDGPYTESKELVGGIGIIEAPDLDAAVAIARRNPATRHGSGVEVREIEGAYTRHITSE